MNLINGGSVRTFKFRAWNKKTNIWQHKEPRDLIGECILFGYWLKGVRISELNDIVIMQFTGMYDKKENEIFEGDIVKSDTHNPSHFIVEYIEGGFCGTYKGCIPIDINHFYPSIGCQIEVVGNIFDNPELKKLINDTVQ